MRTVALVTGAAGWLGLSVVRALCGTSGGVMGPSVAGQREIRCLVESAEQRCRVLDVCPNATVHVADIRNRDLLSDFFADAAGGTVFHCAGVIHPRVTRTFYEVNVEGTRNILDLALLAKVARVVHVSSNSPFGFNSCSRDRFDEVSHYAPKGHYGRSKMTAEKLVQTVSARGRMDCVIVRPPWLYGPGQPARQTLFFSLIRQGRAPLTGNGLNLRSMAYVDNVAQGLLLAESSAGAAGQTYWIADARPYSMLEVVETVRDVMRELGLTCRPGQLRLPGFLSEIALLADVALQEVGLYSQKLHVLSEMNKNIACRIDKAQRELGYAPKVELREGMQRSVQALLRDGVAI